ncbi:hypothetical protein [Mucilaginibacter myungsuensis]|uniref:Uncharacterized protein n=1 Tax=Mucilaginibacter myungsuensis TaxID=649104 RepID=A0A929PWZ9_9SPHI|nr:hypothetical protein [Mucilaginibacter myungsuensis]MBE9662631.1 hypothetical protein [Mucilaginibacter myungsuensis]MDN3598051.1 hypothetical protein [Mucilaginibacter myungsuensis]
MKPHSPWAAAAAKLLNDPVRQPFKVLDAEGYTFNFHLSVSACWLTVIWPNRCRIAFRLAYSPDDELDIGNVSDKNGQLTFTITSILGKFDVKVILPTEQASMLRYTVTLTPTEGTLFPYWPRDILPLDNAEGEIWLKQVGTRSGQLYFTTTKPQKAAILYLQNLSALADYNQQTETSAGETVGGEWPEIGFALPPTLKNKPLQAGTTYVISDAFIALTTEVPEKERDITQQYLDLLAQVYLALPKPNTHYQPWPEILEKGLTDLIDSPGCWQQVDGKHYFNAYVSDHATPPEIMVQLAVMLPLTDYKEWSGKPNDVIDKLREGLPSFYDEQYKTIMRWHPKVADRLEGEEEQKEPLTMDSWYLHHPLLNLSRLALKGDEVAKKLFLDSLPFAIKVAHHFKYQWPVFYKMDTLEVVKEETQPGKGGEKDVPGLYAHVMLQAWELTGEKRYLAEAEKAAHKLQGLGFDVFYQANNTAFSAGALLRLYKITKKQLYLDLSYLCLASVFKNVQLWDCNYGFGKNFPTFFALFPLNDAPYTAVYEEQEVFCAFHEYLNQAEDVDILPSLRLLMAEYIRYLVERAVYYYPTQLPKEMLSNEVKVGDVDHNLWIALEDLHDGWEPSGEVGQEVYGAGNAFGIIPRHYLRLPGSDIMIYTDYPTYDYSATRGKTVKFRLAGDGRLICRLMVIKADKDKLPEIEVTDSSKTTIKGKKVKDGHMEFTVAGDQHITIHFK